MTIPAEPGLLGVSNGAGVALVIAVLLGQNLMPMWLLSALAIVGALTITLLLMLFARRGRLNNARLLLIGVALGIACSAAMTGRSTLAAARICASCSTG